ncbi:putative 3-hydroxyisobutyrate dehydrogenase, mitochondrial [Pseudocercospora fuligena]|uniref:3-hydroxyisobutyrate dehydrogenase n=1 Tax=Pseudocercospora fuligena TaxID=685502 RepID=A0A8H6RFR1_9PEZI|nr:putative 3-hydroxyisobutyrate dehydrogenase, mitochondrial [Pseudocercospora fuligena]
MEDNIAFIGIGAMGYGMAANLRRKMLQEATLYVNDPNAGACKRFVSEFNDHGPVEILGTAKEAAERAGTLLSMVPRPDDVRKIYLDPETGVIAAAPNTDLKSTLLVDSSTIDPATTREVGEKLMKAGVGTYVDAPVSGGIARAADGGLAFMIGHPPTPSPTQIRIQSLIQKMGNPEKVFFCGPLGSGLAAKISNNYLSGSFNVAISQAMSIGILSGVDPQTLYNVIKSSSGQSWMAENHQPVPGLVASAPSSRGWERSFGHAMMMKDLELGVAAAKEVGVEPTMGERALEMYQTAVEDDDVKDLDYTSIYKLVNKGLTERQ